MEDRLDALTRHARAAGPWHRATADLADRVVEMAASKRPPTPPIPSREGGGDGGHGVGDGVRAAPRAHPAAGFDRAAPAGTDGRDRVGWVGGVERTLCRTFPGGEIAIRIEEGSALGSWALRGVLWCGAHAACPVALEWIEDDHVVAVVHLVDGEPFQVEEFAGPSWHLELRFADGAAYRIDAPLS